MMDETALRAAAAAVIAETGAHGPKDMGKVMPALLARVGTARIGARSRASSANC